jgi:cytochrome c553
MACSKPSAFLTVVAVAITALFGFSYSQPPSPKASVEPQLHGQQLAEANCASCHGVDGNSTDLQFPKLAGQKAYYIRSQLHAFKSGGAKVRDNGAGSLSPKRCADR